METELDIRIKSVRELRRRCEVYRWELMLYNGSPIDLDISADFVRTEKGDLRLQIGAHYTCLRSMIVRRLLDYVIEVTFEVDGIENCADISDGEMLIDPDVLTLMMGVALGALRGMVALRTEGSVLEKHPIPIMRIADLIRRLDGTNETVPEIHITGARMREEGDSQDGQ